MTDLLWGDAPRPTRGPRPALTLAGIVGAAIDLADADGLAALSMQKLAARLGSGTMSLYRYVPTRDQLVVLMFDTGIGAAPQIDPADWRAAIGTWARASREAYRRHPWMLSIALGPRRLGPNEVAWTEAALDALSGSGLGPPATMDTVFLLNTYVRGNAQSFLDDPAQGPVLDPALFPRFAAEGRFPRLVEFVTGGGLAGYDHRSEETFEFGLDRILDGLVVHLGGRA